MQSLAARLELDRTWLIMHIIHDTCSTLHVTWRTDTFQSGLNSGHYGHYNCPDLEKLFAVADFPLRTQNTPPTHTIIHHTRILKLSTNLRKGCHYAKQVFKHGSRHEIGPPKQ